MDILHICNEKMRRNYNIEAICNKTCIGNVEPCVVRVSIYLKVFDGLKNNIFLCLDNIRRIKALKLFV